jgi:phosphopantothenoylcysteine decarboxylase/phosphopantothenate--cysteine ligase
MRDAVLQQFDAATTVIMTAAVADYRPAQVAEQKIKRENAMQLQFELTSDILAELGKRRSQQVLIGFAAETENTLENARGKLIRKNADAIVLNDVSNPKIGFSSDRNAVTIISRDEVVEVPESSKFEVAQRVLDAVVRIRANRKSAANAVTK